ncbi:MAG TPA: hypothetical protein VJ890_11675, partial [Vineibacter sp.]|nr:hypothetical protein [Vineibacter sp.]
MPPSVETARPTPDPGGTAVRDADEAALFDWVAETCGGRVVRATQFSGGNRCRSWAVDVQDDAGRTRDVYLRWAPPRPPGVEPYTVRREAQVYRAIASAGLKAPRLI